MRSAGKRGYPVSRMWKVGLSLFYAPDVMGDNALYTMECWTNFPCLQRNWVEEQTSSGSPVLKFFEKGPTERGTETADVYHKLGIAREFLHRQIVESSLFVPRPIDIGSPGG